MLPTTDDRRQLLKMCRATLNAHFTCSDFNADKETMSAWLKSSAGTFVTLKYFGKLRGCIGRVHPTAPLYKQTPDLTLKAAFDDPRFDPMREEEVRDVRIHVSVLSDLEKVTDLSGIELHQDGLFLIDGKHSGLLLPEVASDNDWSLEQLLQQICRKAGLLDQQQPQLENQNLFKFQTLRFFEQADDLP